MVKLPDLRTAWRILHVTNFPNLVSNFISVFCDYKDNIWDMPYYYTISVRRQYAASEIGEMIFFSKTVPSQKGDKEMSVSQCAMLSVSFNLSDLKVFLNE